MELSPHEVTQLLRAWSDGEPGALEKLMPLVYQELYRRARRYMAQERTGHTLSPTALVNEAYLRLVDSAQVSWQNRAHFLAVCAQLMRRILVDWARSRRARKRGADLRLPEFQEALAVAGGPGADLVAVDSLEQARIEAGDLLLADSWANVVELQSLKSHFDPNRVTIFKSLGIGVEDVAAGAFVYERARSTPERFADRNRATR